jgi:hypothetical protein
MLICTFSQKKPERDKKYVMVKCAQRQKIICEDLNEKYQIETNQFGERNTHDSREGKARRATKWTVFCVAFSVFVCALTIGFEK